MATQSSAASVYTAVVTSVLAIVFGILAVMINDVYHNMTSDIKSNTDKIQLLQINVSNQQLLNQQFIGNDTRQASAIDNLNKEKADKKPYK